MFYSKQLQSFSHETALHGFNNFVHAETRFEGLMFLSLVLFSVVMLTRDTVTLVHKYNSEPTNTVLSVMHNESIFIANPTLCIATSSFGYIVNLQSLTEQDVNLTVNQIQQEWHNVTAIAGQAYFYCASEKYTLECTNWWKSYNYSFQMVYLTLIGLLQRENSVATTYTNGYADLESLLTLPANLLEAVELIRQYLISSGLEMRKIFEFTGYMMCRRANIIHYRNTTINFKDFCETAKLTWFGPSDVTLNDPSLESLLCYQFPQTFEFVSLSDPLLISLDAKANPDSFMAWFDVSGKKFYSDSESATSSFQLTGSNSKTAVEVMFDFHSYNGKRQPCDPTDTHLKCLLECREMYLKQSCKCFPISIITTSVKPPNMPYCLNLQSLNETKLDNYLVNYFDYQIYGISRGEFPIQHADCIESYLSGNLSMLSCTKQCKNPCDYMSFSVKSTPSQTSTTKAKVTRRSYQLVFTRFVYPSFTETLSMSWEDFLSAFGGSIGLWLGASLIAFLHIPLFIIRAMLKSTKVCRGTSATVPVIQSIY